MRQRKPMYQAVTNSCKQIGHVITTLGSAWPVSSLGALPWDLHLQDFGGWTSVLRLTEIQSGWARPVASEGPLVVQSHPSTIQLHI
jgi:hypothetical protein